MSPDLSLWWVVHWSRQHPTRQIPFHLWLLWHAHNAGRLEASRWSLDPFPDLG